MLLPQRIVKGRANENISVEFGLGVVVEMKRERLAGERDRIA